MRCQGEINSSSINSAKLQETGAADDASEEIGVLSLRTSAGKVCVQSALFTKSARMLNFPFLSARQSGGAFASRLALAILSTFAMILSIDNNMTPYISYSFNKGAKTYQFRQESIINNRTISPAVCAIQIQKPFKIPYHSYPKKCMLDCEIKYFLAVMPILNAQQLDSQIISQRMKQQFAPYRPNTVPITNGQGKSLAQCGLSSTPAPSPRFKHQSFIYKGRLYLHGGTTIPSSDFPDDPLDLYSCELDRTGERSWESAKTKCNANSKQLQALSAHAGVLAGNKYYSYGGSNNDCKPNSQLLRLNLDTLEWARLDQKGDVPTARQSAFLTFFEKNWLLLYGGASTTEVQIYNTFHFYNLDTKNWSKCDGSYLNQVYARLDPAITHCNNRLYLFGGTYRNMDNQEKYLDDFYQITVSTPARNLAGKILMKRLISPIMPESRSGHKMVVLGQEYLLLIGGEKSSLQAREGMRNDDVHLIQNIWIYSIRSNFWSQLQLQHQSFKFRTMSSCDNYKDRIYLFGGIHNYNTVMGDLVEIAIDLPALATLQQTNPCIKCNKKQRYDIGPQSFSTAIIEDIYQNIDFPYAAVGLLIDNAMNNGASILKITYNNLSGPKKLKLLKFQDDAKLIWTEEELVLSLANFHAGQMYIPSGIDKKIKAGILKDNMRREYGYNLKLGSLRLGQSFLFISFVDELMIYRIFVFEKQQKDNGERYVMYYYSYNAGEKKVSSPEMEEVRTKVATKYGDYIDAVMYHRKCRNTLLIFNPYIQDTREVNEQNEIQMKADFQGSNIIYGSYSKIKNLEKAGINTNQCVDISLRAYITCLYLKNQSMKITLSVKETTNNPIQIQTQLFLEKVDRLCKQKHVLEINPAFEFDLKIIEVYYLYDLKKKLAFFNNGLLIYHKNRLITRFKYPLGELITRKYYKFSENHNFIRLFGFIQLPDHIPINIFKTNYTHHIMMEKLFSRLKFINKMFKKELAKIAKDPDYKRSAPTKLNEEEAMQDKIEAAELKPTPAKQRIKRTEPVQHQISLRKRKSPSSHKHSSMFQQRIKDLLIKPTTQKIEQLIKIFEQNGKKQAQPSSSALKQDNAICEELPHVNTD